MWMITYQEAELRKFMNNWNDQLSGIEFLQYMAGLKGLNESIAKQRIEELLNTLNLTHAKNMSLKGYSGGMKQRIGIAQALLNNPKLLIIDEPTVGLDPQERANFRQLLTEFFCLIEFLV